MAVVCLPDESQVKVIRCQPEKRHFALLLEQRKGTCPRRMINEW